MGRKKNRHPGIHKRETKSGPRYDVEVFLGRDRNGKKVKARKTFETLTAAKAWQGKQRDKKANGPKLIPSTVTFETWLDHWLVEKEHGRAGKRVPRPRTMHDYRAHVRRWVKDPPEELPPHLRLGEVKLRDLTVDHFDALYRFMQTEQGLSPTSIRGAHRVLRMALKHARKKRKIPHNPTDDVDVPSEKAPVGGRRVRAMDREQADAFLTAARGERLSAFFHVQILGGSRPSEAFALGWEHVDFDAGTVEVTRSLNRVGLDEDEHPDRWALEPTKTEGSYRTIPLPAVAMKELRAWKARQAEERLLVGADWQDHGLVFTTPYGTPLHLSNLTRGPFRRVCEAAGLGEHGPEPVKPEGQPGPTKKRSFDPAFRLYDLRHTCATLLLSAGVPLKVVSERLGHSSITLTADTYSHVLPTMQKAAADELEAMFGTG